MKKVAKGQNKVVALIAADPEQIFRVNLVEVRDLARRVRKALYADVTDFMCDDDSRDLTRFLAVVEALAGVLEIELRMSDFVSKTNPTIQRGTQL